MSWTDVADRLLAGEQVPLGTISAAQMEAASDPYGFVLGSTAGGLGGPGTYAYRQDRFGHNLGAVTDPITLRRLVIIQSGGGLPLLPGSLPATFGVHGYLNADGTSAMGGNGLGPAATADAIAQFQRNFTGVRPLDDQPAPGASSTSSTSPLLGLAALAALAFFGRRRK